MPLIVNLRLLTKEPLELQGELPPSDFDFGLRDEMIQINTPVSYDLTVELLDNALLVQGGLRVQLECECVRCLKKFALPLELDSLALHLPLEGEEAATVDNDNVDLTPFLREDMLLEFPQHPLCEPECPGLKKTEEKQAPKSGKKSESEVSRLGGIE